MRKSLFALENADGMDAGEEMEVSQEEGEVADVAVGADDEIGEIGDVADAVSDGADAAGQMEEVEGLVEDAVENGEGLDPVAAEAVRISVEAICARIGANPKVVYPLYATENFASASSRRANSRIALEGIGEFLKDLWKRIKTALTNMWKKVKDFWAKHISSLGRVKKALEATKTKVKASSGISKGSPAIDKAPSSLSSAFAGKGELDIRRVNFYIEAQDGMLATATNIGQAIEKACAISDKATSGADAAKQLKTVLSAIGTGTKGPKGDNYVLILGGEHLTLVTDIDEDGKKLTVEVEKEVVEETDNEAGMLAATKDELVKALDSTLSIIKTAIDARKGAEKAEKATNEALNKINTLINTVSGVKKDDVSGERLDAARTTMNMLYKLNAASAKIQGVCASQNVRLARGVIGFASVSMGTYKAK